MGNYYHQEVQANNTHRLKYFDSHFLDKLDNYDKERLVDFQSFVVALGNSLKKDSSLGYYFEGMDNEDLRLFFQRNVVQDILRNNLGISREEFIYPEKKEEIKVTRKFPEQKKEVYYKATYNDKKTGKSHLTLAREKRYNIKGKQQIRYIDSRGKFVKKAS